MKLFIIAESGRKIIHIRLSKLAASNVLVGGGKRARALGSWDDAKKLMDDEGYVIAPTSKQYLRIVEGGGHEGIDCR